MRTNRIIAVVIVGLVSGIQADSLFNFWSHLIPGSKKSEESTPVNYTVHSSESEERKVWESNESLTSQTGDNLVGLLNPLDWFKLPKKRPDIPFNIDSDLGTAEIIRRHGYPSETHTIQTEDGFLLNIHRIPCGRSGWTSCLGQGRGRGQAVFIQHGLLGSSADWLLNGPDNSLAFLLADLGYDVWLGNIRGNTYSKHHIKLKKTDKKFWDFSWHEMAMFDIPAAIDHVINVKATEGRLYSNNTTKKHQVIYVAHSMGTTMAFAMLASKPEYNDKIKAVFALAPVAFMKNVKSPIRLLAPFSNDFEWIMRFVGTGEFMPQSKIIKYLSKYGCELTDAERYICENTIFVLCGFDSEQFNENLTSVIFAHAPAGTSTKTLVHYAQEIYENGTFKHFDYGRNENEIRYGQSTPPEYNLENVRVPVALIYANNDWLAGPQDVELLHNKLPNSLGLMPVPFAKFNHLDFMWGLEVKKLVYDNLIKMIAQYR